MISIFLCCYFLGYYFHFSYSHYRGNHRYRRMSPEKEKVGKRDMALMNCTATIKSRCIDECMHMWWHSSIFAQKGLDFIPFFTAPCVASEGDASSVTSFVVRSERVFFFSSNFFTIRHNYTCVKYL